MCTWIVETHLTLPNLHLSTIEYNNSQLKEGGQEEERMGGLPGEWCPEEARLGGEAVKRSHQMCWHIMITSGCSRVRGLTGRLPLWLTSAGLFIISLNPGLWWPLYTPPPHLEPAHMHCALMHSHIVKLSFTACLLNECALVSSLIWQFWKSHKMFYFRELVTRRSVILKVSSELL